MNGRPPDNKIGTSRFKNKRAGTRPALSWQTSSRSCVCNPIELAPGFEGGTAISANYFGAFIFFFFFAMMKILQVWTG
jgi:hypothetical protein